MNKLKNATTKGFTLIELLVVIGIIAILAAIVLVAVNPGRQFASARDTQRRSDLLTLTNAIYEFAAEHNGNLPGTDDTLTVHNFPTTPTCVGTAAPCFDLGAAGAVDGADDGVDDPIIPTYVAGMPEDPSTGTPEDTGYVVSVGTDGRVVATAVGELTNPITIQR